MLEAPLKTALSLWLLLGALACQTSLGSTAAGPESSYSGSAKRWLYWVDIGGNFIGTVNVDTPLALDERYEVILDPGIRMDLGAGYRFLPWLRAGLETGYVWNPIDSLLGFDKATGEVSQVPVQALVAIDQPIWKGLELTVGGSAGGVYVRSEGDPIDWWRHVGGNQFVAAYQGFAGITYKIGRRMHLGLQYRLAITDRLDWEAEFWGGGYQRALTDQIVNHGVTALFRADF